MSKHTPGPWYVVDRNWELSTVFSSSGDEIARCLIAPEADDDIGEKFERIKEANARLIAAAPELLEVLQGVLMIDRGTSGRIIIEGWQEEVIRAAIAKATGEHHDN